MSDSRLPTNGKKTLGQLGLVLCLQVKHLNFILVFHAKTQMTTIFSRVDFFDNLILLKKDTDDVSIVADQKEMKLLPTS